MLASMQAANVAHGCRAASAAGLRGAGAARAAAARRAHGVGFEQPGARLQQHAQQQQPGVLGRCRRRRGAVPPRAARVADAEADALAEYEADNFYEILGVSPAASRRDIKRAYKTLMLDFHPDLSGDEDSTEFVVLLNEIYETLLDPERRATYDALAGFSANSINPFADTSLPADQVFVDEYTCIGCRNCTNVCPKTFAIEEEYGRARALRQGVDAMDKLTEAVDTCPVNCIHFVSASQLSLLEAAMARMERVAVWSLMSGGGSGRDVFTEASIAWEKRQAALRARLQRDSDAAAWSNWWANLGNFNGAGGANYYAQAAEASRRAAAQAAAARSRAASSSDDDDARSSSSGSYDDYDAGFDSAGGFSTGAGKEGARIAKLAARAARAARHWKSWQEVRAAGSRRVLIPASVSSGDDAQD